MRLGASLPETCDRDSTANIGFVNFRAAIKTQHEASTLKRTETPVAMPPCPSDEFFRSRVTVASRILSLENSIFPGVDGRGNLAGN